MLAYKTTCVECVSGKKRKKENGNNNVIKRCSNITASQNVAAYESVLI